MKGEKPDIGSLERFRQERADPETTQPVKAESLLQAINREARGPIRFIIGATIITVAFIMATAPSRNRIARTRTSEWLRAEETEFPGRRTYGKEAILIEKDNGNKGEKVQFDMTVDPEGLIGELPKMLGARVFEENGKLFIEVEMGPQISLSQLVGSTSKTTEQCEETAPSSKDPCLDTSRGTKSLVFQAPPHIEEAFKTAGESEDDKRKIEEALIRHLAVELGMQWSEA